MPSLRRITNEPIIDFKIDPHNPICDGLALMIKNGYSYPNKDGTKPLMNEKGEIIIAGKDFWEEKRKFLETKIRPFLDHLKLIMSRDSRDADVFLDYMAFKQQYAGVKPRWAIVLAGDQGVGKDISIEACWEEYGINFINNVSPADIMSPYNDFIQCLLLRISEAADLVEGNRWTFNERLKVLIAGHPDTMLINKKYGFKYWCDLYCGVILTTNHLNSGLYIPKGDRRMYVINCATMQEIGLEKISKREQYFDSLFKWFREPDSNGINGYQYIGNYLFWCRNVENFNPNVCPEPTIAKINVMSDSDRMPEWLETGLTLYANMIINKKEALINEIQKNAASKPNIKQIDPEPLYKTDDNLAPYVFCVRKLKELCVENGIEYPKNGRGIEIYLTRYGYEKLRYNGNREGKWRKQVNGKQLKEMFYCLERNNKMINNIHDSLNSNFDAYCKAFGVLGNDAAF